MYASWDQKRRLQRLIREKEMFVCHNCSSQTFVVYDAFWASKTTPCKLEVQGNCAECEGGASIWLSVEDAKRCGFTDPDVG
jgi:hypothetical protein